VAPCSLRAGTRPTCQPCWSAQRDRATRRRNQHTYDSEWSAQHSISEKLIPRNRRRNTTRCLGRKSAKEPLSLTHLFMTFFVILLSTLISQAPRHRWASPTVSWHSGATQVMVSTLAQCQKFCLFLFLFSKSLVVHNNRAPRTTKVSNPAKLGRTDKHKGKGKQEAIISRRCETFIYLGSLLTQTTTTTLPRTIRRAAGSRRKDIWCQRVWGQARLGPEGVHLILRQVHVVPRP
jgi:hypothetical protein